MEISKKECQVLIAMNQPLLEAGIKSFLAGHPHFKFHSISDPGQILQAIQHSPPDLLIIDYTSPGSISLDTLETLLSETGGLKVLVISSDDDKASIRRAVQLGVTGYLTWECGANEFLVAAESAARGAKFYCSKILDVIIDNQNNDDVSKTTILTTREQEILKLLAEGHSTQRIADALHLSPHTVQTHRKSIIKKLKIKSPTQFVIWALDMGLMTKGGQ